MGIYCAWGVSQGIFSLLVGLTFSYAGSKAAITLHKNSIKRVLRAPTKFFDTTPLGRIINRYVKNSFVFLLKKVYKCKIVLLIVSLDVTDSVKILIHAIVYSLKLIVCFFPLCQLCLEHLF